LALLTYNELKACLNDSILKRHIGKRHAFNKIGEEPPFMPTTRLIQQSGEFKVVFGVVFSVVQPLFQIYTQIKKGRHHDDLFPLNLYLNLIL